MGRGMQLNGMLEQLRVLGTVVVLGSQYVHTVMRIRSARMNVTDPTVDTSRATRGCIWANLPSRRCVIDIQ